MRVVNLILSTDIGSIVCQLFLLVGRVTAVIADRETVSQWTDTLVISNIVNCVLRIVHCLPFTVFLCIAHHKIVTRWPDTLVISNIVNCVLYPTATWILQKTHLSSSTPELGRILSLPTCCRSREWWFNCRKDLRRHNFQNPGYRSISNQRFAMGETKQARTFKKSISSVYNT